MTSNNDTEERIYTVLLEHLGLEKKQLGLQKSLSEDLGVDSLDSLDLMAALNEEFSINIRAEDLEPVKTIQDLIDLVQDKLSP